MRGKCPECRGNDKEEERKAWLESAPLRAAEKERADKAEALRLENEARRQKQQLLYAPPARNTVGGLFEITVQRLWTSGLRSLADTQHRDLDARYFNTMAEIGTEDVPELAEDRAAREAAEKAAADELERARAAGELDDPGVSHAGPL